MSLQTLIPFTSDLSEELDRTMDASVLLSFIPSFSVKHALKQPHGRHEVYSIVHLLVIRTLLHLLYVPMGDATSASCTLFVQMTG